MTVAGEVAAALLEALESQIPRDGFHLEGIEVRVGVLVDLDAAQLHAALCNALPGVEVRMERVEGLLKCKDCGAEYPHDEHPCPVCGSPNATLIHGNELEIARAWGARAT